MGDRIGVASGLLTLVVFGLKCSQALYETVKGFNSHQRNVRNLREELEAIIQILKSLSDAVAEPEADFAALKLPLLRCGNACKEFEAVINKCVENYGGSRTTFQDWARLKYMGDDIVGFKDMIAGYKLTMTIALCDSNLHKSAVTAKVLKEYHHKIEDAISDLKDRLRRVDDIQVLLAQGSNDVNGVEWRNIQAEKESIQKCLDICRGVSSHIDSVRPTVIENILTDPGGHYIDVFTSGAGASAQRRTKEALDRCKDDLAGLLPELASRLEEVSHRQQALAQASTVSANQRTEQARLQEEIESIKQSLKICTQAAKKAHPERTNVFEEVSLTDDGHQLVISTIGDLISAKKVSVGARSHQWLGQMSDESLQQLSRDRDPSSPERIPRLGGGSPQFENTYGRGRKM